MKLLILIFLLDLVSSQRQKELIRPKEETLDAFEFEPGIHDRTTISPTTVRQTESPRNEETPILSVQTVSRQRLNKRQGVNRRNSPNDNVSEGVRQRLDSIILLISRMGDRMVAMETMQTQWKERIDNIQYRLTKMELMDEERKSQLGDVSSSLRHRLQSTDNGLESLRNEIELIKTSVIEINKKESELLSSIKKVIPTDGDDKPKLHGILAAVFGVRNDVQKIGFDVDSTLSAVNVIHNTTSYIGNLTNDFVTKSYLQRSLLELQSTKNQNNYCVIPSQMMSKKNSENKKTADPQDCWELIKKKGEKKSGIYRIQPLNAPQPFFVYCDMETAGGGWTVIQRRQDGSIDFAREWLDYKHGFGNLAGEFWLGNEKIHQLTNHHVNELEINLSDFDQQNGRAHYSAFAMGNEAEGYSLKLLGHYDGDAGDSLLYHVGQRWSTIDSDSDAYPERNCARDHAGAWWYKACDTSNLNGRYLHGPVPLEHEYKGTYWYDFRGPLYSLWKTTMMIRRGGSVKTVVLQNPIVPPTTAKPRKLPLNTTTASPNIDYEPYMTYEHEYNHMG